MLESHCPRLEVMFVSKISVKRNEPRKGLLDEDMLFQLGGQFVVSQSLLHPLHYFRILQAKVCVIRSQPAVALRHRQRLLRPGAYVGKACL